MDLGMSVPRTEMAKAISYVIQLARELADTLLKFYEMASATAGRAGCHCQQGGPKHGPQLNISYRGEQGKTTG